MVALDAALRWLVESADDEDPIVICTDSQSALASLRAGPPDMFQTGLARQTGWCHCYFRFFHTKKLLMKNHMRKERQFFI